MGSDAGRSIARGGTVRATIAGCAGIGALGAATFSFLHITNFRGYDEWLIFWMLSRGFVSFPHANRPLGLVWHAPAWLLAPDRLWGFLLLHGLWLTAGGVLTFLLLRRLVDRAPELAFLAGALTVAWMPSDETRIATVQMIQYSGCAAGVLLATWLLFEAAGRRSRALLLAAILTAVVTALSFEATLATLAFAPLLLLVRADRAERRQRLLWAATVCVVLAILGARLLVPQLAGRDTSSYQFGAPISVRPVSAVLWQLGRQLSYEVAPLATIPSAELASLPVALVVLAFVAAFVAVARASATESDAWPARRTLVVAGLLGLAHAALGFLPFVVTHGLRKPVRTEFLSAAGVAVLLAAAALLTASLAPPRGRRTLAAALGTWLVAVGTSRTFAQQRAWDSRLYVKQRSTLEDIVTTAPALAPHTLVVLLQSGHTWMFGFSFSKAVEYLYRDRARGWVTDADPYLLETQPEQGAIVSRPAAVTRGPWRQAVERYRPDELVVFAEDEGGRARLLDVWPEALGPLPNDGVYAPRVRLHGEGSAARRLEILPRLRPPDRALATMPD